MKNQKEYLDKIISIIQPPYFYELETIFGITNIDEQRYIFKSIFGDGITMGKYIYYNKIYNDKKLDIYRERTTDRYWNKNEYNDYGYLSSYEDKEGCDKIEYDSKGTQIWNNNVITEPF